MRILLSVTAVCVTVTMRPCCVTLNEVDTSLFIVLLASVPVAGELPICQLVITLLCGQCKQFVRFPWNFSLGISAPRNFQKLQTLDVLVKCLAVAHSSCVVSRLVSEPGAGLFLCGLPKDRVSIFYYTPFSLS